MTNKPNIKIFNVYKFFSIEKSEKTEVIFKKLLDKLLEYNEILKDNNNPTKNTVLHLNKLVIKILKYFNNDNKRKEYDKILENQVKKEEYLNKSLLFTQLIDEVESLEKEYKININLDYIQLLEIISFISYISNKEFRIKNNNYCDYKFGIVFLRRVFNNAVSNNRKFVIIDDFITVALNNEKLLDIYKEKFANDIFNNWYHTLKK